MPLPLRPLRVGYRQKFHSALGAILGCVELTLLLASPTYTHWPRYTTRPVLSLVVYGGATSVSVWLFLYRVESSKAHGTLFI